MEHTIEKRSILIKEDLVKGFQECGIKRGDHLFVHCSLKRLGYVVGGAETVIRALMEVVGEEGTLLMPTQSWKNLDPSRGVHWEEPEEWWQTIRDHWPAYDKQVTPSMSMGAVAEMFRTWPGTVRSDHPARSVAAWGKHADYLTKDHDLSNIFGEGSPVAKLYELDGSVLFIGVGHNKNTSLHLAETRATFSSKRFVEESSAILVREERQWVHYTTQDVDDADFVELGEAFDKEAGIKPHQVGDAPIRYFKQRPLVDFAVRWMEANR